MLRSTVFIFGLSLLYAEANSEEKHREDRQPQPLAFSVERFEFGESTAVLGTMGRTGYTKVIKPGENVGFPFPAAEKGQYPTGFAILADG